uniref:Replicative DNA helicase n=1 Tax=Boldia erythrosiphon TaxID=74908 RepID=A0A1Y9TLP3_9RHOD|nr:replication helicase subunit [Boldia erythrosiphon]ARO90537.1 replication helicase subunit [Boldia erythrosiphon]
MLVSKRNLNNTELPNNIYAEKMILGAIILNPNLIYNIIDKIKPNFFFKLEHVLIYSTIISLYNNNKNITLINLINELEKKKILKKAGGIKSIYKLTYKVINNNNFEEYAYLVLDKYFRRRLIEIGTLISELGYNKFISLEIIVRQTEDYFLELTKDQYNNYLTFSALLENLVINFNNKLYSHYISGISSGFKDFDSMTQGFQKSDLIILASRPSMGKTSLSLNIAHNIASYNNKAVAIFSLEMPKSQLVYRMLATSMNVSMRKIKAGRLNKKEWRIAKSAIESLSKLNIYIYDEANLSPVQLKSKIFSLIQKDKDISFIIVDYLQLLKSDNTKENRSQELSTITRSIKIIARDFNIPIMVLSQLSRNVELRNNKRPILADLRESGCLEKNTLVKAPKQQLDIRIRYLNILNYSRTIYCKNKNNRIIKTGIKKIYTTGKKGIYQLVTETGYYIKLTSNHKIQTLNGWKRLDEILITDQIMTIKKTTAKQNLNYLIYTFGFSIKFETIESIYFIDYDSAYDIVIKLYHNLIGNNIIIHNSIEQDADMVCMIYRDEYYNAQTLEPNTAEILIVKQRNGPIGSFKLNFNLQSTKFSDMN